MAYNFNGNGWLQGAASTHGLEFRHDEDWCVNFLVRPTFAGQTSIFAKWPNDARQLDIGQDSTGSGRRLRVRHNAATGGQIQILAAFTLGRYAAACVGNRNSTLTARVYNFDDGILRTQSATLTGDVGNLDTPVSLANRNDVFPIRFQGDYALAQVFDRELTAQEFDAWIRAPIMALDIIGRHHLVLDIRPGMIDPANGDHVDFSPTLGHAFDIGTGSTVVVGPPVVMTPRLWKNWAPSAAAPGGPDIGVPLGQQARNGLVPAVGTGVSIAPPVGVQARSGQVPEIGTGVSIFPPPGSQVRGKPVPAVGTGVEIKPPAGARTRNGLAPQVGGGVDVQVPLGLLSRLGLIPSIGGGIEVVVPTGTRTRSGLAPGIATGVGLAVPSAQRTRLGVPPDVGTSTVVPAPTGIRTRNGIAPTVASGAALEVPQGQRTRNGLVPAVSLGARVAPPSGLRTRNGIAPAVGVSALVQAPIGLLTRQGLVPSIEIGVNIVPPSGLRTRNGIAPALLTGVNVQVPLGLLSRNGIAPGVGVAAIFIRAMLEGRARPDRLRGHALGPTLEGRLTDEGA